MAVSVRCHGIFCECSRTTQVALRGKFIQTLTEFCYSKHESTEIC